MAEPTESIKEAVSDIATLIRHDIDLAKAELAEKAKSAAVGAGMFSVSAMTGFITLGCLTALVAALLALVLPVWAALLIVTVVWGAATAVLALLGKRKIDDATPFVPEQTIADIKEDVAWARQRAKQSRT